MAETELPSGLQSPLPPISLPTRHRHLILPGTLQEKYHVWGGGEEGRHLNLPFSKVYHMGLC